LLIIHSTRLSPKKKKKASVEEKGNCELLTEDFRNWIQKLDFLPWIGIKTKFTDGCFAFRRVEEERERKKLKKNNTLIVEKKKSKWSARRKWNDQGDIFSKLVSDSY
jgi:hypothetical protein